MNTFQCKTSTVKKTSKSASAKSIKKHRSNVIKKTKLNTLMNELSHLQKPSHNMHIQNEMPLQQLNNCNHNSNTLYQSHSQNQYLQHQQMVVYTQQQQRQHEMQQQNVKHQHYPIEHYSTISNMAGVVNNNNQQHIHQQSEQLQHQVKLINNIQYNNMQQFDNNNNTSIINPPMHSQLDPYTAQQSKQQQQQHHHHQQQQQQQQNQYQESTQSERNSRPIIESIVYFPKDKPMLKLQQNSNTAIKPNMSTSDTANNAAVFTTNATNTAHIDEIVHQQTSPIITKTNSIEFEEIVGRKDKIGALLELTGIKNDITSDIKEKILDEITDITDDSNNLNAEPPSPYWFFDVSKLKDPEPNKQNDAISNISLVDDSGVVVIMSDDDDDDDDDNDKGKQLAATEVPESVKNTIPATATAATTSTTPPQSPISQKQQSKNSSVITATGKKSQVDEDRNDYSEFYYIDDINTKQAYNKIQENQVMAIDVSAINNNNNTINTLSTIDDAVQQRVNNEIPCISLINLQNEIDKTQNCKFDMLKQKPIESASDTSSIICNTEKNENLVTEFKVSILINEFFFII
ncbi:putative protein [Drosophila innubila nudivirus]|uniref:Uncharacterized protein n=1 Tax=Drosophila innubila nudivirus TaxID=2057187 RepID=A0A2H4UX93_9VIRU|nr:putative protein [Drosophila innubila nudivirus]ATZ81533.1 putative protein [Drosophila innubila nudivirus]